MSFQNPGNRIDRASPTSPHDAWRAGRPGAAVSRTRASADADPPAPSEPPDDLLSGLDVHELDEPEIFVAFFG